MAALPTWLVLVLQSRIKSRARLEVETPDAPDFRSAQPVGPIAARPVLGGLHHQYVGV